MASPRSGGYWPDGQVEGFGASGGPTEIGTHVCESTTRNNRLMFANLRPAIAVMSRFDSSEEPTVISMIAG
jgi:hypothetical protein